MERLWSVHITDYQLHYGEETELKGNTYIVNVWHTNLLVVPRILANVSYYYFCMFFEIN